MDTKYNGWKNYATWNWALWMGEGDEFSYFAEIAKENNMDRYAIIQMLTEDYEEKLSQIVPSIGPFNDILTNIDIDWGAIADHIMEDIE